MLIHFKESKLRKDRYTLLSETVLETLRQYWRKYKPVKWIFGGAREWKHLSVRSMDKIFKNACDKAVINRIYQCIHRNVVLQLISLKEAKI